MNLDDFLRQVTVDIITILTAPPSSNIPCLESGDPTRNALLKIATCLHRADTLPSTQVPPSTSKSSTTQTTQAQRVEDSKKLEISPPMKEADKWKRGTIRIPQTWYNLRAHARQKNCKDVAVKYLVVQEVFRHHILHIFDNKGNSMSMEKLLKGPDG